MNVRLTPMSDFYRTSLQGTKHVAMVKADFETVYTFSGLLYPSSTESSARDQFVVIQANNNFIEEIGQRTFDYYSNKDKNVEEWDIWKNALKAGVLDYITDLVSFYDQVKIDQAAETDATRLNYYTAIIYALEEMYKEDTTVTPTVETGDLVSLRDSL